MHHGNRSRLIERSTACLHGPRLVALLAVALLGTHAGLLAWSATRHSPTLNEPGHLVAGLSHWQFGRFELYRVDPPLVRMLAALPVLAAGYKEDWSGFYESPGARPEFAMGSDFIKANGERSIWLFTIARWACIPISLIGGLFCFFWARELAGHNVAGLIALTLWCFDPNILAHGELITPDCAATSFGVGATYFFWRWLKQPDWSRAFAAGLLLGLAELSRTSWIILFGLWPLLWLFWQWTERRRFRASLQTSESQLPTTEAPLHNPQPASSVPRRSSLIRAGQLACILLFAVYLLNLAYGFEGTFTRLGDFEFVSDTLSGKGKQEKAGNRFRDSRLAAVPVPLPANYVRGIDIQKKDFEHYGQPSYLRGEWKQGGWWYYYIYGLAVKTPHGTQLLLLLSIVITAGRFWRRAVSKGSLGGRGWTAGKPRRWLTGVSFHSNPGHTLMAWLLKPLRRVPCHAQHVPAPSARGLVVLATPAIALLVLVSSQLEFNHHVRYVLPVLGFTFVFIGSICSGTICRKRSLAACRTGRLGER